MASNLLDTVTNRLNGLVSQLIGLIGTVTQQVQAGTIKIRLSFDTSQKIIIVILAALLLGIILALIYNRSGFPSPLWLGVSMVVFAIILFVVLQMSK